MDRQAVSQVLSSTAEDLAAYLKRAYRYRYLLLHLAGSDMRARFRGSYIGALWLLINPLIYTAIFVLIFGTVFAVPLAEFVPYVLIGIVVWEYISSVIAQSTQSILAAEGYLKQSRIPLIMFCFRTVYYLLTCFLVGLMAAVAIVLVFQGGIRPLLLMWVPVGVVLATLFVAPIGILSAVATTRFRDYHVGVGHVLMVLYYLSPVFIPRKEFERPQLKFFSELNPITSLLDVFRDPLLTGTNVSGHDIAVVLAWSAVFWALAALALSRTERDMIHYF